MKKHTLNIIIPFCLLFLTINANNAMNNQPINSIVAVNDIPASMQNLISATRIAEKQDDQTLKKRTFDQMELHQSLPYDGCTKSFTKKLTLTRHQRIHEKK